MVSPSAATAKAAQGAANVLPGPTCRMAAEATPAARKAEIRKNSWIVMGGILSGRATPRQCCLSISTVCFDTDSPAPLTDRGVGRRLEKRNVDHAADLPALFDGFFADLNPIRVGAERVPGFFARREIIERNQVGQGRHVLADQRRAVE